MAYSVSVTVTLQLAVLAPSSVFTVITASPAFCAVTLPSLSTAATSGLSELHVTVLFVAFAGLTVAFNVTVSCSTSVTVALSSVTPLTAIDVVTFVLQPSRMAANTHSTAAIRTKYFIIFSFFTQMQNAYVLLAQEHLWAVDLHAIRYEDLYMPDYLPENLTVRSFVYSNRHSEMQ